MQQIRPAATSRWCEWPTEQRGQKPIPKGKFGEEQDKTILSGEDKDTAIKGRRREQKGPKKKKFLKRGSVEMERRGSLGADFKEGKQKGH